jgi:hypothetical protein
MESDGESGEKIEYYHFCLLVASIVQDIGIIVRST